ncbi:5-oxoprolinase subunit PxpB [Bacillus sp. BRMEA1]|nr:5-oxoprolinase subunit PxpB [Neobacillus endophyticus]
MVEIRSLGDAAISVVFGNEISESIHHKIQQFISLLEASKVKGIVEWVPAYTTVAVYYRPGEISYHQLTSLVEKLCLASSERNTSSSIVYKIPVYYGGETGSDLSYIAKFHTLREEEVVKLHCQPEYLIYMMGFVPGFPYLGGLSPKLAVPRLEHPRPSVLPGSVGIGGKQTGIYPSVVPSGWRILGITPIQLFDIDKPSPILLSAGNYIKFYSIDVDEYLRIKDLVSQGKFTVQTYKKGEFQLDN